MSVVTNVNGVMHKLRIFLYPSFFKNSEGGFYARTSSEATLNVEGICANLKARGGYLGRYEDLVENVKQFLDEMVYSLCDGFRIHLTYLAIYPHIGGIFGKEDESFDPEKHPITFRFKALKPLMRMTGHIAVEIQGLYDQKAFISTFADRERALEPNFFLPDDMFCITGNKIMIEGDEPDCGVFFVPEDITETAVKVKRIGENGPQKIVGIAPNTHCRYNRIEIRTRHSGNRELLKTPRVIRSKFIVEAA